MDIEAQVRVLGLKKKADSNKSNTNFTEIFYLAFTVCLISCSCWSLFPTVERLDFKKAKSFLACSKKQSIMPVLIIALIGNNSNSLQFPNSKKNGFCGNCMRKYGTCKFTYFLHKTFFLGKLSKGGNFLQKYVKLVQLYVVFT